LSTRTYFSAPIVGMLYDGMKICDRDDDSDNEHIIKRRFVVDGRKWITAQDKSLRWSFRDEFHLIKKDIQYRVVKAVMRKALEVWSKGSQGELTFEDVSPKGRNENEAAIPADIEIEFARYEHGDKESFDGRGGIVAHSAYPREGIIHFDGSEYWSVDGRNGSLDLRFVALHEIGHALGLRHSRNQNAIMHPYYRFVLIVIAFLTITVHFGRNPTEFMFEISTLGIPIER
uniref:MMP-like protein (inferred by orthology to a C. elegans protein) n=1 Tax=Anisakis simplex TaxID=6269 RepID=A0A0M3K2B8_ANISI